MTQLWKLIIDKPVQLAKSICIKMPRRWHFDTN